MGARDSILVTGGAGFVGSHFVCAAHDAGCNVVALDDLSAGTRPPLPCELVVGDIADRSLVTDVIRRHHVTAVVHFAGKIQVAESVTDPSAYFDRNVTRTLALLDAVRGEVGYFVFSSTAAVYGMPSEIPILESAPLAPINPYGATKVAIESALAAYGTAYEIKWAALRYFNAAGARRDGTLREGHTPETHLIPLAIDAALGRSNPITIYGNDYATADGTCIRDYVHVDDLADGHLRALDALDASTTVAACNLGSASGYSVREIVEAIGRELGRPVPHSIGPRRPGDPPVLIADNSRARQILGWSPDRSELSRLIEDAARSRRA